MVWFIMAGMAALAALAAIWPLLRGFAPGSDARPPSGEVASIYEAQLDEIERDVARGLLPQSEAASARAEAARRLLATKSAEAKTGSAHGNARLVAAAIVAASVPAIAFPLYLALGQPNMPDEPIAGRPSAVAARDMQAAVAGVEAHLIAKPDDGRGWAVLAPVYMRLGRFDDAARAYSEALRWLGEDSDRRAAYGEALVAAGAGVVTASARATFEKALAEEPGQPQARFYLALAAEQDGKTDEALKAYRALIADAPPGAGWREAVQARIAALTGGPPAAGAAVPDTSQQAMIEGMVGRLADRLATKGGSLEEWGRLIRAYTVLHQADKAKAALGEARKALAPDSQSAAQLDALARDLGLGDVN